jgi:LPS export ABC transporter protein LptC
MSYFKPRNLLLVMALALALILLAVIGLRYRPASQLQTMVKALPKGVDVSMQDIDYTHLEEGQARWRLVARQVARQAETGVLAVNRPRMSFYDAQGESAGSLEADQGEVSDDYQKVRLSGHVVLKNPDGYTLYTDHLDYDQASKTATTDAHVQLVGEGVQLEGTGLVFNVPKRVLHLRADVKGSFDPAKRE